MFEPAQVFEASNAMMVGPQGEEAREALSRSFYTEKVSEEDFEWSMRQARKMPPDLAGRLMLDHAAMDVGCLFVCFVCFGSHVSPFPRPLCPHACANPSIFKVEGRDSPDHRPDARGRSEGQSHTDHGDRVDSEADTGVPAGDL